MEINELQNELTEIYRVTMDYDFHKASYEMHIEKLKEKYAAVLQELARICDSTDEELKEQVASCVPEYVAARLLSEPSKRKRETAALDYKMNMVSFFIPLLGEMPAVSSEEFTRRIVKIWNAKMPEHKIGHSTYGNIKGGFKKGIFCYITTAVCRSLDKPDDCYELTALRNYRDEYLLASDDGKELVREYYNIAPTIVKRIGRKPDADHIYREIWEDYLNPCIRLIEQGENEKCREKYSDMVRKLEAEYLYQM